MPDLDQRTRAWRARIFTSTGLCYAGFYFCRKPFYVAKASLEDAWGWDAEALGWLGAAYLVAYAAGQFVSAYTGTRFGPRRVLLVGMAISMLCNVVFGLTSSLVLFALFMVANGFAQASGWANVVGTMGRWFRRTERGSVMGVWGISYTLGSMGASALAGWLLKSWGLPWAFFGGVAVLLGAWIFFWFNQRDRPEDLGLAPLEDPEPEPDPEQAAVGSWSTDLILNVALVGAFYFCLKFVRYALWSWTPYLLSRNYGLQADDAAYLSTVFDLAGLFGVIVCGWLSDRLFGGKRAVISLLFVGAMVASTAALYLIQPGSVLVFAVFLGLIGFTLYGPDALMAGAAAVDVGSADRSVAAAGIINGIGSVGSVLQALVMGRLLVADDAVGPVFLTLMGSSIAAAACMAVLVLRGRMGRSNL